MTYRFPLVAATFALCWLGAGSPAMAQITPPIRNLPATTYVSGAGNDGNDCSVASPCRTFVRAMARTASSGTISCRDAADFGNLTVTQSLTIDCLAGSGGSNTAQIVVNAPQGRVQIKNLTINAIREYSVALDILAAASVDLLNVAVTESAGIGIFDHRGETSRLSVTNSSSSNNAGPAIVVAPQSGNTTTAELNNFQGRNSTYGLAIGGSGRVTVQGSQFFGNSTAGVEADPNAVLTMTNSATTGNNIGVMASPGSTVTIDGVKVVSNNTAATGTVQTYGNNTITGNTVNNNPTLVPVGTPSETNGLR